MEAFRSVLTKGILSERERGTERATAKSNCVENIRRMLGKANLQRTVSSMQVRIVCACVSEKEGGMGREKSLLDCKVMGETSWKKRCNRI